MKKIMILLLALGGFAVPMTLAGPADQKGGDAPDIAAFRSAKFNLTGFFKVDGITVDVSGQGSLAPPEKSAGTYKFGPITLEMVTLGDQLYARSRFDPQWEVQEAPSGFPITAGPIVHSDVLPKGPMWTGYGACSVSMKRNARACWRDSNRRAGVFRY